MLQTKALEEKMQIVCMYLLPKSSPQSGWGGRKKEIGGKEICEQYSLVHHLLRGPVHFLLFNYTLLHALKPP